MSALRVLSVDWDYFFPDISWYDWGHREAPFFINQIWAVRTTNRNLKTGASVMDEVVPSPSHRGFWSRVVKGNPKKLVVSESHLDIVSILTPKSQIVNCDAHHDCGYYPSPKYLDCGNWCPDAPRVSLYYPEWRKEEPETHPPVKVSINYGEPARQEYDMVFVCRSGAWTPPWHDDAWVKFVKAIARRCNTAKYLRKAEKPRELNMRLALKLHNEQELAYSRLIK